MEEEDLPSLGGTLSFEVLDVEPVQKVMAEAGIDRIEITIGPETAHGRVSMSGKTVATLERDEICDDEEPLHPGLQGVFALYAESDPTQHDCGT